VSGNSNAVFLSYASQDAEPASRICDALRTVGIEVWFDQSELRGGDAWDATIRRQIKSCALFVPIISNNTHSRGEGYFRLEWKLAVDRSHLMAADQPFLVPVVVDDVPDTDPRVPERFREVQWTKLPGGETPSAFVERVQRLLEWGLAPSRSVTATPSGVAPSTMSPPSIVPTASSPPLTPVAAKPRKAVLLLALLAGVAALAAGAWVFRHGTARVDAVAPYSIADRRMTFAVLPFQSPADDTIGAQTAKALTYATDALQAERSTWVHSSPRASVDHAASRMSGSKELAEALNVHFLITGLLAADAPRYKLTLSVIDGATEHVLATKEIDLGTGPVTASVRRQIDDALDTLVFAGVTSEVERMRAKPVDELDVRDLSFRAYVDWFQHHDEDGKGAYTRATDLLKRALTLAPDDRLALWLTAQVNLCNCVYGWSSNPAEQQAIGAAALDKALEFDPTDLHLLAAKSLLFELRGRYEESLLLADAILKRDPERTTPLVIKARDLLKLGRPAEALPLAIEARERIPTGRPTWVALLASIHYALGEYAPAAELAQKAAIEYDARELSNGLTGPVRLTLAAAQAKLGDLPRAKAAIADFRASVPGVQTIAQIKKWIQPAADLSSYEPLYDGLRLAGVPD
jgi:TolB-like protein